MTGSLTESCVPDTLYKKAKQKRRDDVVTQLYSICTIRLNKALLHFQERLLKLSGVDTNPGAFR